MTSIKKDELVLEIGTLILKSERYSSDDEWIGLALVGNLSHNQLRMNGYVYFEDDFEARTPEIDVLRKLRELREEMAKEKGEYWHQCLIHITRPEMKINIQFEYDDPERWSLKKVSLDMKDYAESLKPPM